MARFVAVRHLFSLCCLDAANLEWVAPRIHVCPSGTNELRGVAIFLDYFSEFLAHAYRT
jgi:hypothetical protein